MHHVNPSELEDAHNNWQLSEVEALVTAFAKMKTTPLEVTDLDYLLFEDARFYILLHVYLFDASHVICCWVRLFHV